MSTVFPNSNLPEPSQQWGKEVQKRVESLQSDLIRQKVNSDSADSQLQSSYKRIDETLNGLFGLGEADSPFSINANNINAGTINGNVVSVTNLNAANITSGTISSARINSDSISAANINADKIVGGTITGIVLRSGTGGQRVEIEEDGIALFSDIDELAANIFGTTYMAFGGAGLDTKSGLQIQSDGNMFLVTSLDDTIDVTTGVFRVFTYVSAGDVQVTSLAGAGTTSASIDNAGFVIRTPSSTKYKQDIEPLEINYEDLISLEPKRFRLKKEAEADENARYYAGFIAEEIAETSLTDFVSYKTNEDGAKEPDGVYYAELSAALLSALKKQDELIKSLTARVEDLENKDRV
jgi:hypothetical protein